MTDDERKHERDCELYGGRFLIRKLYLVEGIWYARVRDTFTGKVRKRSLSTAKKSEARKKVKEWLDQFVRDEDEEAPSEKFDVAMAEWLRLRELRPSTRVDIEASIAGVYVPHFGSRYLEEVDHKDVEEFMHAIRERSARTRKKHLTTLRAFFRWAVRRRYLDEDPSEGIPVARVSRDAAGKALSIEEAKRLLAACRREIVHEVSDRRRSRFSQRFGNREYLYRAVLLALYTGLRRGNVLGLAWRHVDLSKKRIEIPADEMKSKRIHTLPIHPVLATELAAILKSGDEVPAPEERVIGRELKEIKLGYKHALEAAGLEGFRWHDLRHTFATWLSTRTTYAVLQRALGHSPSSVTALYVHVPWGDLRKAVATLPDLTRMAKKSEMA